MADKYVPAEEVADVFSMTVHAVRGWRRKGTIPDSLFIKVGGHYRYDLEGIVRHFRGVTTDEADKRSEEVKEDTRTPLEKLQSYSLTGKSEEFKAQLTEMDFAADEDF